MNRTEKDIRRAFEKATPDVLDTVLSHDCHEKGIVVPVTKRKFVPFVVRKLVSAIITLLLIAALVAVMMLISNGQDAQQDNQITICEENGQKYIQLPVSETRVYVKEVLWAYLDLINYDLLLAADEAAMEKVAPHTPLDPEEPYLFLTVNEGEICLYLEMIAFPLEGYSSGCEDHIHIIGQYPITVNANISEQ